MKLGWEYVDENGQQEKLASKTVIENVLESKNGPAMMDIIRDMTHPIGSSSTDPD